MLEGPLGLQARSVLEAVPDAPPLHELLTSIDDFVIECSLSLEHGVALFHLEEELQQVHHDVVDHSSLFHTEVFLAILYHLGPILPPTSVISWFDIVLRPALREPKLPTTVVNHAKELIISALCNTEKIYSKRAADFRCRLLDLYLLDAYNEGSGDDVLEWAELDEEQREKRSHWKSVLEDILLKFGLERPDDLLTELYVHFGTTTSRLQLLMLLNTYTSSRSFETSSPILAAHPLMLSITHSLLLDTSSTVCTTGLTLLVKLLPIFAVHARKDLKAMFPMCLAILARIMCWKERIPALLADEPQGSEFRPKLKTELNIILPIRPDYQWNRLELTFDAAPSPPPSTRSYFTILYYLYPSNVLQFLSGPADYLALSSVPSPYTMDWEKALDQEEIRRRSERLVLEHVCHPLLLWRDAATELSSDEFWFRYSLSRIISEASMLDVRRTAVGVLEQIHSDVAPEKSTGNDADKPQSTAHLIRPISLTAEKACISLEDMINATLVLKSNLDVDIVKPVSQWPHAIFTSQTPSEGQSVKNSSPWGKVPFHIIQVISGLQREILLLRNELNFELWLSRENVKYIGRLYQDRIQTKAAETERQGLYNKLRNYRQQVIDLEKELSEHKEQASSLKNKYADWNRELQKKLKEFREEKKTWISEAAHLRKAEREAQDLFGAQGKLLGDALAQVSELQTQKKETQHKVDRLRDYERQIDQHIQMQRLWDDDFATFNRRGEEITLMRNQYQQMKLQLESYEKTQAEMDDAARVCRRRTQTLEAQLGQALAGNQQGHSGRQRHDAVQIASLVSDKGALAEANQRLKTENIELKDELEELRAMIEILKGQHSSRQGLVAEPRSSPVRFV